MLKFTANFNLKNIYESHSLIMCLCAVSLEGSDIQSRSVFAHNSVEKASGLLFRALECSHIM